MTTQKRIPDPDADRQAQGHRAMALGWLKRGRVKQAIVSLEKAIDIDPAYLEAYLELGRILLNLRRWADLEAHCRRGLVHLLDTPELHKMLITALEERGALEDAYERYGLERRDRRCLDIGPDEILCCLVARNERPRLAYFLEYYRTLGVDRFFVVDNGSTDGSVEWLLEQPNVHVWQSELLFKRANFGSSWFELLLRRYGVGHWCLTLDADEFLFYQGAPDRSLKEFCRDLERRGKQAATGLLLDLYSDRQIRETIYREGDNPLDHCAFFDRKAYHRSYPQGGPYRNQQIFFGGVRQRVFPAEHDYLLSKCVLLRYQPDVVLASGQHLTNIAEANIAAEQACVLHFKFFASFLSYARVEAQREAHAMGAEQYKCYHHKLEQEQDLILFDPGLSVRFEDAAQLRELGILKAEDPDPPIRIPAIEPIESADAHRPFWSVMISLYNRAQNVERVLSSVLSQADESMQIEVVCDFSSAETQAAIAAEVARVGGERVRFHPAPARIGHPDIFNLCIERARGRWVHILHDDDWVEPGFYQTLRREIETAPAAGAAFCQFNIVSPGDDTPAVWRSWQERETPGIVDDWLSRIGTECRVQFSAMTVRRDVYERLGGFCAEAKSAFDWEMWIRIAANYPVYFIPEILVSIGRDGSDESSRLIRTGEQIAHVYAAIDLATRHFPAEQAGRMAEKAREQIAAYAFRVAGEYLNRGKAGEALANLRAAVAGRPSSHTVRRLKDLLQGEDHEFRG